MGRCRYIWPRSKNAGKTQVQRQRERREPSRTFQRNFRSNYRVVNCDEWEAEPDNGNDYNVDRHNSNYQEDHPLSKVNLKENRNNYSPNGIEFEDICVWGTGSEVGNYFLNRSVAGEYRDAGWIDDCDVFGTYAKTNSDRRFTVKKERSVKWCESPMEM